MKPKMSCLKRYFDEYFVGEDINVIPLKIAAYLMLVTVCIMSIFLIRNLNIKKDININQHVIENSKRIDTLQREMLLLLGDTLNTGDI